MSRKDTIKKMGEALLMRRQAIMAALQGDMTLLQHISEGGCDVVDFASDSAAEELSSQLVDMESRELASIDEALIRLKNNTYGVCEGCQKSIPLTRLRALPYASLCIACQRAVEDGEMDGVWPSMDTTPGVNAGDVDPV